MTRDVADHLWDSSGQITSTGSANAYVIATTEPITGYYQGMPPIRFKANFSNTGSATVDVNGLGAVTLKKYGGATNLASGDIVSGGIYTLIHDGTNFQVLELQPTAAAVSGFPMTASGDRWGVLAPVGTDGVMEIGRILDFHNSDADATDNGGRIRSDDIGSAGQDLSWLPTAGADSGVLKRFMTVRNSTLAQGDVFYYDGANFVRLPPGTSGQFLQTLGAAANPQWAAADGDLRYVTSGSLSGVAQLDVSVPANCNALEIELQNWVPATDNTELWVRFSQSGSFLSGASDYAWGNYRGGNGIAADAADNEITLSSVWGNGAAELGSVIVRVLDIATASTPKSCTWHGYYTDTAGNPQALHGGGRLIANNNAIDGVRFLFSSGNISSGRYVVRAYSNT